MAIQLLRVVPRKIAAIFGKLKNRDILAFLSILGLFFAIFRRFLAFFNQFIASLGFQPLASM